VTRGELGPSGGALLITQIRSDVAGVENWNAVRAKADALTSKDVWESVRVKATHVRTVAPGLDHDEYSVHQSCTSFEFWSMSFGLNMTLDRHYSAVKPSP
jgi:hypothetical protein